MKARISGPASSKSASEFGEDRAPLDSLPSPQEPQSGCPGSSRHDLSNRVYGTTGELRQPSESFDVPWDSERGLGQLSLAALPVSNCVAVALWRKRDALLCGTNTFCSPGSATGGTGSMRGSAAARRRTVQATDAERLTGASKHQVLTPGRLPLT